MPNNTFDPFSSRRSRDVRNAMSRFFAKAVAGAAPEIFRNEARALLATESTPAVLDYIHDRLTRYEKAFAELSRKSIADPLQQAAVLWNQLLFFEVHECLENVWHKTTGEARQAYQGLIMAAAVYVHLESGNIEGAKKLAAKASAMLRDHRHLLEPTLNLAELLKKLERVDPIPPRL